MFNCTTDNYKSSINHYQPTAHLEPLEPRILLTVVWPSAPLNGTELFVNQNGDATLLNQSINPIGDHDPWEIYFELSGTAHFETAGSTDTEMAFYIGNGPPTATDDDSGASTNAKISEPVLSSTKFSFDIAGFNDTTTGFYNLLVNGPPASVTPFAINPVTLSSTANANISHEFDFDFFVFTPQVTGSWSVIVHPLTLWDPTFNIYNSMGNPVAGSFTHTVNVAGDGLNEAWAITLAADQPYFIRVDGNGNSTGDYSLNIVGPSSDTDINDQINEAVFMGTIPLGGSNSTLGSIAPNKDVDIYFFNVEANQSLGFDIDNVSDSSLDSFIRLFDIGGNLLAFNNNRSGPPPETGSFDSYMTYTFENAGSYYLGVSSAQNSSYDAITGRGDFVGSTGIYDLIISDIDIVDDNYEQNDTLATATDPLNNSGNWSDTWLSTIDGLPKQHDQDWYLVNVKDGNEHLTVEMQHAFLQGNIDMALYDASETLLASSRTQTNIEAIDFKVPTAGDYFVKVYNSNQGNVYDLRFETQEVLEGDANLDGEVGLLDLDILGKFWGKPGAWADGDFSGDGIIGLLDLDILGKKFRTVPTPMQNSANTSDKTKYTLLDLDTIDKPATFLPFHTLSNLLEDDEAPVTLF